MICRLSPLLLLSLIACGGGKGGEDGDGADGGGAGGDGGGGEPTCTSTGFLTSPTTWTLPAESIKSIDQWADLAGYADGRCDADASASGSLRYTTFDLTGDGAADLVVTFDECTSADIGNTVWLVYPAEGSGFASSPTEWTLPPESIKSVDQWADLAGSADGRCQADSSVDGTLRYTLLDMTGDGAADLLVTQDDCVDDSTGDSTWLVYENTGSGFASSPTTFALPPESIKSEKQWSQTAGAVNGRCQSDSSVDGDVRFQLLHLVGDEAPDMVVTQDDCVDETTGDALWLVYENTGAGFASSPTSWSLPPESIKSEKQWSQTSGATSGRCQSDSSNDGTVRFALLDLSGDGAPDITVTFDDCNDSEAGESRWRVYENTGSGFSSEATDWSLPAESIKSVTQWENLAGAVSGRCQSDSSVEGTIRYTLLDLSADGAVDLLVSFDDCTDPDIGEDHWLVYGNEGNGFSSEAKSWSLPPESIKSVTQWENVYAYTSGRCQSDSSVEGTVRATLGELTGDGAIDVIVTFDECNDGDIGNSIWWVYPGDCR